MKKINTARRADLETQTLELLEFDIIREELAKCAKSPGGADLVMRQGFDCEPDTLNRKKDIVSDWKRLLESELKNPGFFFPEIDFLEKLGKKGTVLEGAQLADAAEYIKSSSLMKNFCIQKPDGINLSGMLAEEAAKIPDIYVYSSIILKELNPDGTVRDNHPELRSARSRIAGLHGKINKLTSEYLNDNSGIWQSGTATQRDGRILLPVKSNHRGRLKGFVHEVSSSGATVFIEPFELVDLNNEMAYEQSMLNQLVFRIYRSLTERLREVSEEFKYLVEQVSYVDSWYARADYSLRNKCVRPIHAEHGIIIKNGRHPLLGKSAVPISLSFADELKILIITGPNAGGKTVTLKTCGLFVLMNQFAAELPADEGTSVGVYKDIYADIGDDQSIKESLSTFSGHMKRISEIVGTADQGALVLLDELGSGTDPVQGSAIAVGILDYLREGGVSTIVTSHHAAVKNFGYTHKGAVNASVSFDSETMKPTYRIIEGVPGESHAIEIAESMGLPSFIIKRIGECLENGDATVSKMIKELETRQHKIIEREKDLAAKERNNIEDRRKLDLTKLKIKQKEHEINSNDYSKFKNYVRESRKELENLVREIREGEITKEKTKKVKQYISTLNKKLDEEKDKIDSDEDELGRLDFNEDGQETGVFKPGEFVRYVKNNKTGILIEERKKHEWLVAFGNIKLTIKEEDLRINTKGGNNQPGISALGGFSGTAVFELDIRGLRVYEVEAVLEKQIDAALLGGMSLFSIIHGLGEGALQKTVRDYLSGCSAVRSFEYSDPEHGGYGKTIVRL